MNNASNSGNFKTAMFADCLANSKEIFQLVDQVFPLDSCRHYEVLPLKLLDSNLTLGMLDPHNEESLKFVNSIAKVFQYHLEIQLIDLQTHQIILANYPQNSAPSPKVEADQNKTVIDTNFNPNKPFTDAINAGNRRRVNDSTPTIISQSEDISSSKSENPTKLPGLPPDLDFFKDLDLKQPTPQKPAKAAVDLAATLFEIPPEFLKKPRQLDDKPTIIGGNPAELLAQEAAPENLNMALVEAQISDLIAETLAPETADFLPQLTPQLSWQKLLEQAFRHQTEYISLSRYSDRGSIIASKNKSTQSLVEQVPLPIFCSLIDEIKRMARLPQTTSSHPKKVVLERFYEQERILLRLEFSFQEGIEKVGIQILRSQALENYEQQQMDKVSEQALQLAKQLEKTLKKIQACFNSAELTNLRELQIVQSRINHQLRLLDK